VSLALAIVYLFDPARYSFYPPCVFRALTGLQCPGCGGTRAVYALLHGDVAAAWALNPMVFVLGVAAVAITARPTLLTRPWFAWAAAAVLIGWGVFRNIAGV
jgi:hypothetical protein